MVLVQHITLLVTGQIIDYMDVNIRTPRKSNRKKLLMEEDEY